MPLTETFPPKMMAFMNGPCYASSCQRITRRNLITCPKSNNIFSKYKKCHPANKMPQLIAWNVWGRTINPQDPRSFSCPLAMDDYIKEGDTKSNTFLRTDIIRAHKQNSEFQFIKRKICGSRQSRWQSYLVKLDFFKLCYSPSQRT